MTMSHLAALERVRLRRRLQELQTILERYGVVHDYSVANIKMIHTPWMVDEAGNPYRLVFAAGSEAA